MLSALTAALRDVARDESVGCVVLTGAGEAFCAGADLKGMADDHQGGRTVDPATPEPAFETQVQRIAILAA
jgi:enoyl-CoA hydratase/carnithine racemase